MPTITNSGMPLTIGGITGSIGDLSATVRPLFIKGGVGTQETGYFPVYTFGVSGVYNSTSDQRPPLFINGGIGDGLLTIGGYIPMVLTDVSPFDTIPLIINPPDSTFESPVFSLFIRGGTYTTAGGYIPSFIKVDDTETKYNTFPLYISVNETVYESIPMFVQVNYGSGSVPIYIRGIGYKLINDGPFDNSGYIPFAESLDLFINRVEASEVIPLFLKATDDTSFATIPMALGGVEGLQTASIPLSFFDQDILLTMPLYVRGRP